MSDSSVDCSTTDQEMVYIIYVADGKSVNRFVDVVSLEHANSQGLDGYVYSPDAGHPPGADGAQPAVPKRRVDFTDGVWLST